ncbi:hypothetical protein NDU88_001422 [Pleurodeles waltl]|uniref:Uncharacterized protein n=1 Tax=Pleurodeles waltl TaxID=8319 RepID=A0AAV7NDB2_PLEWA|nr:hypothetical protein NDU88_001422 [Pleurodeles waltl]
MFGMVVMVVRNAAYWCKWIFITITEMPLLESDLFSSGYDSCVLQLDSNPHLGRVTITAATRARSACPCAHKRVADFQNIAAPGRAACVECKGRDGCGTPRAAMIAEKERARSYRAPRGSAPYGAPPGHR